MLSPNHSFIHYYYYYNHAQDVQGDMILFHKKSGLYKCILAWWANAFCLLYYNFNDYDSAAVGVIILVDVYGSLSATFSFVTFLTICILKEIQILFTFFGFFVSL